MPLTEPLPQIEELATLEGVHVSLAPRSFDLQERPYCEYREIAPSLRSLLSLETSLPPDGVSRETHREFEEVRYMRPELSSDQVEFLVTVTNRMERVFRGQGAVFQFAVDGRVVASDAVNYQRFLNAIVPPGGETQLQVRGPSLSSIGDDTTLALNIYDIMAETDEAGNVTRRDNAEWFFRIVRDPRQVTAPGERSPVWIPNGRASTLEEGSLMPCVSGARG